MLIIYLTS